MNHPKTQATIKPEDKKLIDYVLDTECVDSDTLDSMDDLTLESIIIESISKYLN